MATVTNQMDYSRFIEDFTNSQNLAEGSIRTYSFALTNFLRFLQKNSLTRKQVAIYIKKIQDEGLSEKTIARRLTTIRCFARYLWEEDLLSEKEYKKINGYKVRLDPGEDDRRALTSEEEERGYQVIVNPLLRMLYWTGLNYGLRRSEYINLKLHDMNLNNRTLTIRHSKGNKTRRIKILKTHVPIWQQWFKTREAYQLNHDYVFFTDRGKAGTRTLERYFNKISEILLGEGNKEFTSHALRYTFAVKCWRSGMDLLILSKILGHASLRTTQTYLRVTENEILKKYEEQASRIL